MVGDDTDLFVLLLHHANNTTGTLFLFNQRKKESPGKLWDFNAIQQHFGPPICRVLLCIHALLGCGTTSRLYGIGKAVAFKLALSGNELILNAANSFLDTTTSKAVVEECGEKVLLAVYDGEKSQTLNDLRWEKLPKKNLATATKSVKPEDLPQTTEAATHHLHRVYLQV